MKAMNRLPIMEVSNGPERIPHAILRRWSNIRADAVPNVKTFRKAKK